MLRSTSLRTVLCLALLAGGARAGTLYVDAALVSGDGNGTSWADAFQGSYGLRAALAAAVPGDQIWVAQGSYEPTPGTLRSVSLVLRNGVEVYGGFAGTESSLDQRDFVAHVTVLTGDLNGDDGSDLFYDNSFHVLDATGTDASAVLDGFTVGGGNANGPGANQDRGGGILCLGGASPTLRNCVLRENRCSGFGGGLGGACYAETHSNPTFVHCVFRDNSAVAGGAGYIGDASPSFVDCRFESNVGSGSGGALYVVGAAPTLMRCVFRGNSAGSAGALALLYGSDALVTNCVFWNNTAWGAPGGGAIYVALSNPVIRQCIIAGNRCAGNTAGGIRAEPAIELANDIFYFNEGPGGLQGLMVYNVSGGNCSSCCVQGIGPGAGNIPYDPLFADLGTGDLHLARYSPCADAGDNQYVPAGTTRDLDGNPRLADDPLVPDSGSGGAPVVDIGAYELPNTLYSPFCAGDGSLATACPCGNTGAAGRGCRNSDSFSPGALLVASGSASPDSVVLTASDMLPSSSCVFLQGNVANPFGALFGDGVRCTAGTLVRLYVKSASGGTAGAPGPGDPPVSARSAQLGDPIAPGSQRCYQVYYRDSNLGFCPAPQGDSWNVSSGLILNW